MNSQTGSLGRNEDLPPLLLGHVAKAMVTPEGSSKDVRVGLTNPGGVKLLRQNGHLEVLILHDPEAEYSSVIGWRGSARFIAAPCRLLLLASIGGYKIVQAQVDGNHLELQIESSKWKGIFECTLDSVGKLWYDRRPPKLGE